MVWSCFSWDALGPLVIVEGTINSEKYQGILGEHLLSFLDQMRANGYEPVFQEDNAPCHKSFSTQKWKLEYGVKSVEWPPYSPDLNPIEHLWDELKRRVYARNVHPSNRQELINALKEEWSSIEPGTWRKLILSMPRRIKGVLDANGGSTKY
jgi:hypothetical protein